MVLKSAELPNGEQIMGGDHQGVLAQEEKKGKPGWRKLTLAGHPHIVKHSGVLCLRVVATLTHTHSQTLFIRPT